MTTEYNEGNKIIAEFMGAIDETRYFQASTISKTKVPAGRMWMADRFPNNIRLCSESDLQYHTSWDWQIPAWSKLIKLIRPLVMSHTELKHPDIERYFELKRDYERGVESNEPQFCQTIIVEAIEFYTFLTTPTEGDKK